MPERWYCQDTPRRLDVRSEGGTLIQVGVFGKRPEEPEEAMDIANTIAEELRAFRIEQQDSPAEMLEMSLRFTPPYFLLGIAAAFVLGLLAGGGWFCCVDPRAGDRKRAK